MDAFVVMPNHVHGIVVIVGAGLKPAPTTTRHGLPEIVRQFKTFSARRINEMRGTPGVSVWQRNDDEHIIRNEESLNCIREYIANNPLKWQLERENLGIAGGGF
ncbi:transposase [Chloroflexus aggregans]|nr:transposase [Chloroflexus aggregans]